VQFAGADPFAVCALLPSLPLPLVQADKHL
jgi:hypothetical protein